MKSISTILLPAMLFLVGIVSTYSDAYCSQSVTWTIKNGAIINSGSQYRFEVWARATDEPVLVQGTYVSNNYNPNAVCIKWNSSAFHFYSNDVSVVYTSRWKYPYYSYSWGGQSSIAAVTVQFWVLDGVPPASLSQNAPDGEMICSVTLKIYNASFANGIDWCYDYSYWPNIGIIGAANTFTIGDNSPLPIQLSSFKAATLASRGITLTWTTASEMNNYGFNVQRDGLNIAFIQGHGTTIEQQTYSYTDNPGPGKYKYRLQQVDLNGTATLSESILMDVTGKLALNQNYPNPFNPSTQIAFAITNEGPVSLRVYDILGREVATLVNENRKAGKYTELFNGSQMASGVYVYVLRSSEGRLTSRMILSK